MIKKRRTYLPRIVGDKVMMPADLKRLRKYMLDVEHIGIISDEMRAVVEELWPEVVQAPAKRAALIQGREICEGCVWAFLPYLHFYSPAARKAPPMR